MRRFRILLLLLLICLCSLIAHAAPERRVALVIGNGAYRYTKLLSNPRNDAAAMGNALKKLGFDVEVGVDLDKAATDAALRRFGDRLEGAQVALFFYGGHGMQVNGDNYILPVDVRLKRGEKDLDFEVVNVNVILKQMEEVQRTNLVFLDACRDNPLAENLARSMRASGRGGLMGRGLASINASTGTLISYATRHDTQASDGAGENSPYTRALLSLIERPGLEVGLMLRKVREKVMQETNKKQVPWEYGSLLGEFYFAGGPGYAPQPAPVQTAALSPAQKPSPVVERPKVAEPSAGKVDWDVLERQGREREKSEAAARSKWASWQTEMRAAVGKAEKLEKGKGLSAQQKAEAWLRVASAYTQKNPYSDEDDALRAKINSRADHWSGEAGKEAERQAKGEAARLEAERRRQELAAQKAKAAEEARLAAERMRQEQAQRLEALKAEKLAAPKAEKKAEKIEVAMAGRPSGSPGSTWRDPVTGVEFVWVPKGCFRMGSNDGDSDEKPVHEVCVDGFWMGKYAVTNGEYRRFKSGHDSGSFKGNSLNGDRQPVVNVSWNDAKAFVEWLSGKGNGRFRLPTEAEWEYAARAGTTTARFWGDNPDDACTYANVADLTAKRNWSDWTVHNCDDGYAVTAPVGSFRPNAFGLYDMLGNVWQWCEDVYDSSFYGRSARDNPVNIGQGADRVLRGGSWSNYPAGVRSASRSGRNPDYRYNYIGFRLVRAGAGQY